MSRTVSPARREGAVARTLLVLTVVVAAGVLAFWTRPDVFKGIGVLDRIVVERELAGQSVSADVLFAFDSAELRPDAVAELNDVVLLLRDRPDVPVVVAGHADSTGDPAYNVQLSERRARAVVEHLRARGVTNDLAARGFGASEPVASNATAEGRAANRRVAFAVAD